MRGILIDVTRPVIRKLQGRLPTGIDRVTLEYIEYFATKSQALVRIGGRWLVLGEKDSQKFFGILLCKSQNITKDLIYILLRTFIFPAMHPNKGSILFNIGHSGLDNYEYGKKIRKLGLNAFFFLHDLIPISHPEYCKKTESIKHRRRLATMLNFSSGIIVNSADTAKALKGYANSINQGLPNLKILSLASSKFPMPLPEAPLAQPYFVIVGTIEPRKNHLLLLQIWRDLIKTMQDKAPSLVIVGRRGWECEQVINLLDRSKLLNGFVFEKSKCSDSELSTYLYHARALLFPSFVEGYGIPLVEALSMGVPVIASDLPIFHEIAGEIPEYLDTLDGVGWKKMIQEYMKINSSRRVSQLKKIKDFKKNTWEDHFKKLENWIKFFEKRNII